MKMNKYQKEMEQMLELEYKQTDKRVKQAYGELEKSVLKSMDEYLQLSRSRELKPYEMLEYGRLETLLKEIQKEVAILADKQIEYTQKYLETTGKMSYNSVFYNYEMTTGTKLTFTMLPKEALLQIIDMKVDSLRLSERILDGNIASIKANIQAALFEGFAKGHSYQKIVKKIKEVSGSSYKRAMTIVRTEGGRVQAMTAERSLNNLDELDIKYGKQWVATLDSRTRHSHAKLDGKYADKKGYFHVNGHKALQPHMFGVASEDINCRCVAIAVLLDEKGEPLVKHSTRRDNETGKIIKNKNYNDWVKERLD